MVALSERLLAEAQPTLIGWRSLSHEGSATSGFHTDGRRFEVATSCIPLFAGLDRSLGLLEGEGTDAPRLDQIQARAGSLWQQLQGLAGVRTLLHQPPPAGLVSFVVEGMEPGDLVRKLGKRGLWLRTLDDPHCLRACTHITTTEAELAQLVGTLAEFTAPGLISES